MDAFRDDGWLQTPAGYEKWESDGYGLKYRLIAKCFAQRWIFTAAFSTPTLTVNLDLRPKIDYTPRQIRVIFEEKWRQFHADYIEVHEKGGNLYEAL